MARCARPGIAAFVVSPATFCSTSSPTTWSVFRSSRRGDDRSCRTHHHDTANRTPDPQCIHPPAATSSHNHYQPTILTFFNRLLGLGQFPKEDRVARRAIGVQRI